MKYTTMIVRCPYCGSHLEEVCVCCCGECHGEEVEVCETCLEDEYCECEEEDDEPAKT
jgi:hypothetical protein